MSDKTKVFQVEVAGSLEDSMHYMVAKDAFEAACFYVGAALREEISVDIAEMEDLGSLKLFEIPADRGPGLIPWEDTHRHDLQLSGIPVWVDRDAGDPAP